ncbi:uncharacterized protein LOC125062407 isoform X3 [Pieris napi]|uniref:uncharacterized protein LOC125062407 isoform X3 n=1 Tax=Pieris napi TaxID=78633 RepID=UPI001FB875A3|nr:uncharacterized protein LOC125062407 isoform X3 [Pieris napi]
MTMDGYEAMTEAVKNADVLSMLQDVVTIDAHDEQSQEIKEKIQDILKQYEVMGEEDRTLFVDRLKEALTEKLSMKMQENDFSYWPMFVAVFFVASVIVFFGYKLYKSIKEKEMKKEEKKKQKQSKKKK